MHRTRTTATLLVTVAVSALAACVTVQRPSAPGPPVAPSQPVAPRPDGVAETPVVQAPALEALEMTGPSRRPKPAVPAIPRATPAVPAPARPQAQQPPRARPAQPARPEPRRPADRQDRHPRRPHVDIPDVPRSVPADQGDVCALGRKYGGWQADSPQSVICDQTYGG